MVELVRKWPDHPGFASDLAIVRQRIAQLEPGDEP